MKPTADSAGCLNWLYDKSDRIVIGGVLLTQKASRAQVNTRRTATVYCNFQYVRKRVQISANFVVFLIRFQKKHNSQSPLSHGQYQVDKGIN